MIDFRHTAEFVSLVLSAGLLIGNAVAGDSSVVAGPTAPDQSVADQFGDALTAQGWTRVEGADGDVVYRTPVVPEPEPTQPADAEGDSLADNLSRQLEAQGWTAVPTEDGSVYYLPPAASPTPGAATRSTPALAEALRDQLEREGWVGMVAGDGSMIYRRRAAPDSAPPVGTGGDSLADDLSRQLEAQGWTASPAEDGSVYYLPPSASPMPVPAASPAPSLTEGLRNELERQGWVGTVADDGSVIYRMPAATGQSPTVPAPSDDSGVPQEGRQDTLQRPTGPNGVEAGPPLPEAGEGAEQQQAAATPPGASGLSSSAAAVAPLPADRPPSTALAGPRGGAWRPPASQRDTMPYAAHPGAWPRMAPRPYMPHGAWQTVRRYPPPDWRVRSWAGSPFGPYRWH